jgi:hypothetical protein
MDYNFSFTINDVQASLSPSNGMDSGDLGALLRDLGIATNPKDGSKVTLKRISNSGYTSEFVTKSEIRYLRFVDLHKKIYERTPDDLMPNEAKYAKTLKRVLKDGMYMEPRDMDSNLIVKIEPSQIEKSVDSYFTTTNVYGIISLTGAPSLKKGTHIYLDGLDYKIRTSPQQDTELRNFYRKGKLSFLIRQKKSVYDNRVLSATLVSFKIPNQSSLIDNLSNLSKEDISSWWGISA